MCNLVLPIMQQCSYETVLLGALNHLILQTVRCAKISCALNHPDLLTVRKADRRCVAGIELHVKTRALNAFFLLRAPEFLEGLCVW